MADGLREIVAHYAQYGWFLAIWGVPLAALTVAGVASSTRSTDAPSRGHERRAVLGAFPTLALIALTAFLGVYAYALMAHEDLVGIDYAQLTAKRFVGMMIWPESGRFFPLGLQEYNLLSLVTKTAWFYHAFSVMELAVLLICVFRLLDELPIWLRCVTAVSLLVVPAVQLSFFGLVFPERDLIVWLAVWLVCVQSFSRTTSRSAWYAALIVTQCVLYYKETAFTIVGGFAGLRLVAGAWNDREALRRGELGPTIARHSLEIAMLGLCGVFLAIYAAAIRPHVTASYVAARPTGSSATALAGYLRSDLILDALLIAFGLRMIAIARAKTAFHPLWDSAAAGAIAYALAFIKLGIVREYYLAPADFLAALYLGYVGYDALRAQPRLTIAGALIAVALLFQSNLRDDAYVVLIRKQLVAANVRLAEFLTGYSRAHGARELPLFFAQPGGFQLMELSSFLQYKGLRAEATTGDSASAGFAVLSAHRYPDARCHPSQAFRCEYASAPRAGDLVILLPGHAVSPAELASLRAHGRELMHFTPQPAILERALAALVPNDRLADLTFTEYVFEYGPPND